MPREIDTSLSPPYVGDLSATALRVAPAKTNTRTKTSPNTDDPARRSTTCLIGNFAGADVGPGLIQSVSTSEIAVGSGPLPEASEAAVEVIDPRWEAKPGAESWEDQLMAGHTIVARDIHKGFGPARDRTAVVRGVSLSVKAGETVFLVGPSGSGKTTLLSALGCILTPDQGSVEVLGRDVATLGREELAAFRRKHLGFIFQTFNLFPTLSAIDNVRIALAMRGVDRAESSDRAAALLGQVGLSHRVKLKPGRLSTGECQRVAIARALAGDPAILLADEPTASLDAENGQAVMAILSALVDERGLTLLIVTHDNRIVPFADRILRLEDGRLAGPEGGVAVPHSHLFSGPTRKARKKETLA